MISLRKHNEIKFNEFKTQLQIECGLSLIRIRYDKNSFEYFYEFSNLGYPKENFTISEFERNSSTHNILMRIEEYYDNIVGTLQDE